MPFQPIPKSIITILLQVAKKEKEKYACLISDFNFAFSIQFTVSIKNTHLVITITIFKSMLTSHF